MSRTMKVVLALAWTMAGGVAHAAMQKGDTVQVVADGSLKSRPMPDAEPMAPAPAGASATLATRISNTSGDWWYVEVDGKRGWLPESALAAAPAAPVAAPIPAPVPAPTAAPVAATPTATPAQTPRRRKTDAGSDELGVAFEFADDDLEGLKSKYLNLDLRYGYCYTDVSEFGLQASYSRTSIEEFSSDSYLVGPFFVHNIASSSPETTPFVGVLLGITKSDFFGLDMDGRVLELSGGMRYFAAEDFSVNFSAYYRKSELDFEGYDLDGTTFGFRIGVSGFIR